jgi:hypothetical protein
LISIDLEGRMNLSPPFTLHVCKLDLVGIIRKHVESVDQARGQVTLMDSSQHDKQAQPP